MKHNKHIIILITAAFFFVACGSSTDNSTVENTDNSTVENTDNSTAENVVQMKIGESYEVFEGQSIERYSDDTRITIETDLEKYTTTVTLQAGKAGITTEEL